MRRTIGFALVLGVLGCTRINPAFDSIDELGEDETETGDGDPDSGDGDGEPGDGDGEPGDGDGEPDICQFPSDIDPYEPALFTGAITVDVADAPGFALQPADCQILTICAAAQPSCGPNTQFLFQLNSGGVGGAGISLADVYAIQMQFSPGKPSCGLPPLILDPNQSIEIHSVNDQNVPVVVPARLPCFEGTELRLWVGHDGSTFYDADLQQPAALW